MDIAIIGGAVLTFVLLYIIILIELLNKETKINNLTEEIQGLNKFINENKDGGDTLLYMAMTQDIEEPLKYTLLEKSVYDYGNPLASLILGGYYEFGVFRNNGNPIKSRDLEKASEVYEKCCNSDTNGAILWNLGWFYENNLIKKAKRMDEKTRYKKAFEFYSKSAEKGFPKAYNSKGKFYQLKLEEENLIDAIKNFEKGMELGDIYATINCGHCYNKKYKMTKNMKDLEKAVECFKIASEKESNEAYLSLAKIYEKNLGHFAMDSKKVANFYIKATSVNNQYGAAAYYKLGDLLSEYKDLQSDSEIIRAIKCDSHDSKEDIVLMCYIKSYNAFFKIISNGRIIGETHKIYYDELVSRFKNKINN